MRNLSLVERELIRVAMSVIGGIIGVCGVVALIKYF